MDEREGEADAADARTTVERAGERAVVVTRVFDAPAQVVFVAWSRASVFRAWWVPPSMGATLLSCEMDVRVGGGYRLVFGQDGAAPLAFFGRYLEVVPGARLAWTNEEQEDGAVTTVTFEEADDRTRVVLHEAYRSSEARDAAFRGMEGAMPAQFAQLDAVLLGLGGYQTIL